MSENKVRGMAPSDATRAEVEVLAATPRPLVGRALWESRLAGLTAQELLDRAMAVYDAVKAEANAGNAAAMSAVLDALSGEGA